MKMSVCSLYHRLTIYYTQEVEDISSTSPSTLPPIEQHITHLDESPVGVSTGQ